MLVSVFQFQPLCGLLCRNLYFTSISMWPLILVAVFHIDSLYGSLSLYQYFTWSHYVVLYVGSSILRRTIMWPPMLVLVFHLGQGHCNFPKIIFFAIFSCRAVICKTNFSVHENGLLKVMSPYMFALPKKLTFWLLL